MNKLPICPNCRGSNILISYEKESEGNFFAVFFGIFYLAWFLVRCAVGLVILIFYDVWRAVIEKRRGRSHIFISRRWFRGSKKSYYCQDCKTHFKG
ncbi:MAG: hypothetical protein E7612_04735 [Ruminococcaceae bacterium]|nr:hypothetical protein [Oscillospiraceae bacterium]